MSNYQIHINNHLYENKFKYLTLIQLKKKVHTIIIKMKSN